MRILVTGDRNWEHAIPIVLLLTEHANAGDTVIHGAARGADTIAAWVAGLLGLDVEAYPANWKRYGRAAGPIRNQEMLDAGIDIVLAFHHDISQSKGTKDMVTRALKHGVSVFLHNGNGVCQL